MTASTHNESGSLSRRAILSILAVAAAFAIAIGAAFVTGTATGQVTQSVEGWSFSWANFIGETGNLLPFGFAFVAGMVASVNPCGFAMLPAYLGIYLGNTDQRREAKLSGSLARALWVSAMVTVGFVIVFGLAGILFSIATTTIAQYMSWLGLAIGALLIIAAGFMLSGKVMYSSLGERFAGRLGASAGQASTRGYAAYGVAYALASLSCTFPIFMGVVATSTASGGVVAAFGQFLLYALGMGLVITTFTLATAIFKSAIVANIRGISRYVQPVSSIMLLAAGAYIVYYWLSLGGLLETII